MQSVVKLIVSLMVWLSLSACQSDKTASELYLQRLANVLGKQLKDQKLNALDYPSRRRLYISPPSYELSVREFLSLRQCKLHVTLAHRNSLIGKVSPSSQLLFSDIEVIANGKSCLAKIENDSLRKKLATYIEKKQDQLDVSFWNAIFAGQEMQKFWSHSERLKNYPNTLRKETRGNLDKLSQFVADTKRQPRALDDAEKVLIEQHLGHLRFGDAGQLLIELQQIASDIQSANRLLEQAIDRPFCLQAKPTNQALYFSNVMNRFFIDGIQHHALLLKRRAKQIMPSINQLEEELTDVAPKVFKNWQAQRAKILAADQLMVDHALLLEQLFEQCGLKIGTEVGTS